jgi:ribonuclease R
MGKKQPSMSLDTICEHISQREIKAQKASRDSIKYMQCIYMKDNIGKIYKGIVSSVVDFGFFVELIDSKAEGIIRIASLPGQWEADLTNYCIKQKDSGLKIRLGDELDVTIESVDIEKKTINLNIFY